MSTKIDILNFPNMAIHKPKNSSGKIQDLLCPCDLIFVHTYDVLYLSKNSDNLIPVACSMETQDQGY